MVDHGHDAHGNTVAAWTCVGILIVSAAVLMVATILVSVPLVVLGVLGVVIGLVAGKVLSLAGYGAPRPEAGSAADAPR